MKLLSRVALRIGRELAQRPEARAKAAEVLTKTKRVLNDDVKPRAQKAWKEAQPKIQRARTKLKRVAQEVREEYRKGRDEN